MANFYEPSSEPISLKEPAGADISQAENLNQIVEASGFYEDKDSLGARAHVVDALKQIVFLWIQDVAEKKSKQIQSKGGVKHHGTQVLSFGGQALGVVKRGGDIDVVCTAPRFIDLSDFFGTLVDHLNKSADIHSIRKIEGANVPLLQFSHTNIKVDLSLAILRYENIPADVCFASDGVLSQLDHSSVRSISGIRDAQQLTALVPDQQAFVETLKAIKMWAIRQGIHGSVFGYPGGIAWTILVARVCQLYPLACASMLVCHFFRAFSRWNWPQPVLLKPLVTPPTDVKDTCVQWDSKKNAGDRYHLMPVITPAFPEHNCCFTVNCSSQKIIQHILTQAKCLCEKIEAGQSEWDVLFKPVDFFSLYKHYLMITAKADSAQGLLDWCGFLESQLRKLVEALQVQEVIQQIQLFPKQFCDSADRSGKWFIGLKLQKLSSSTLDLSTPMQAFVKQSKSVAADRGVLQEDMKVEIAHVPRKQLESYVDTTPVI